MPLGRNHSIKIKNMSHVGPPQPDPDADATANAKGDGEGEARGRRSRRGRDADKAEGAAEGGDAELVTTVR